VYGDGGGGDDGDDDHGASENMTKQIISTLIGNKQTGARRHQVKSVECINHNK
jgi:hypothetical protein